MGRQRAGLQSKTILPLELHRVHAGRKRSSDVNVELPETLGRAINGEDIALDPSEPGDEAFEGRRWFIFIDCPREGILYIQKSQFCSRGGRRVVIHAILNLLDLP